MDGAARARKTAAAKGNGRKGTAGMQNRAAIAAAAERNKEPILQVLQAVLPRAAASGGRPLVLEIASGTGQHAAHFAAALPQLDWQPSDPDPAALDSIAAHRMQAGLPNLLPPLLLDAAAADWPLAAAAALFCANMIHIAPWQAAVGLAAGAGRLLPAAAPVALYGPFRRDGRHTAPSNAAFDESLQARDPRWGIRDLDEVAALFATQGFALAKVVEMPANNLTVLFRRERRG